MVYFSYVIVPHAALLGCMYVPQPKKVAIMFSQLLSNVYMYDSKLDVEITRLSPCQGFFTFSMSINNGWWIIYHDNLYTEYDTP